LNVLALPASVGREDGLTVQPFTGKILSKPEIQDAKFGVLTGAGGGAGTLSNVEAGAAKIIAERKVLAESFYRAQGFLEHRIASHLRGIDFEQAVEVTNLPKGKIVSQYQSPNGPQGNYYSAPGASPSSLGISPTALDPTTNKVVLKSLVNYVVKEDVPILKSTAAPIKDTWSIPGQSIQTDGGGKQMMTTAKDMFEVLGVSK